MPAPERTSRAAIVAAGTAIVDEGGLDALTMQEVALRVAMLCGGDLNTDTRVRKTASSLTSFGHETTLLWVDPSASTMLETTVDGVRVITRPGRLAPYRRGSRLSRRRYRRRFGAPRTQHHRLERSLRRLARRAGKALHPRLRRSVKRALKRTAHGGRHVISWAVDRPLEWMWQLQQRRYSTLPTTFSPETARSQHLSRMLLADVVRLKPDVIHAHDVYTLGLAAMAKERLARSGRRITLVYDAHEYIPGIAASRPAIRRAWSSYEREHMPTVDYVVTVSSPIAARMKQRYSLPSRPLVVLNTPAGSQRGSSRNLRAECGVPATQPLLLYSGGVSPQRGILELVGALEYLPDAHLAVIAVPSTSSPHLRPVREEVERLGVADRVHFLNPVSGPEIVSFLSSATVGVHPLRKGPSNHEMALPNKLFEYLHAGLPIAVSDTREMARFVRTHRVGQVFPSGSARGIADAVENIIGSYAEFRSRVTHKELRRQYSWETQAEGLRELYDSIQQGKKARHGDR